MPHSVLLDICLQGLIAAHAHVSGSVLELTLWVGYFTVQSSHKKSLLKPLKDYLPTHSNMYKWDLGKAWDQTTNLVSNGNQTKNHNVSLLAGLWTWYLHPPNDRPCTKNVQFSIIWYKHKSEKQSEFSNISCKNCIFCRLKWGKRGQRTGSKKKKRISRWMKGSLW